LVESFDRRAKSERRRENGSMACLTAYHFGGALLISRAGVVTDY